MKPLKITWTGEKNRPLKVERHCDCGTCQGFKNRVAPESTGYLTWSDAEGEGLSVFISEPDFQYLKAWFRTDPKISLEILLDYLRPESTIV
jgi:hypothetical protein